MISDQDIQRIKKALPEAKSVFPDAQIAAETPDRSEKYKTGFIDKLKAGGIECEVWKVYIKKSEMETK